MQRDMVFHVFNTLGLHDSQGGLRDSRDSHIDWVSLTEINLTVTSALLPVGLTLNTVHVAIGKTSSGLSLPPESSIAFKAHWRYWILYR